LSNSPLITKTTLFLDLKSALVEIKKAKLALIGGFPSQEIIDYSWPTLSYKIIEKRPFNSKASFSVKKKRNHFLIFLKKIIHFYKTFLFFFILFY